MKLLAILSFLKLSTLYSHMNKYIHYYQKIMILKQISITLELIIQVTQKMYVTMIAEELHLYKMTQTCKMKPPYNPQMRSSKCKPTKPNLKQIFSPVYIKMNIIRFIKFD